MKFDQYIDLFSYPSMDIHTYFPQECTNVNMSTSSAIPRVDDVICSEILSLYNLIVREGVQILTATLRYSFPSEGIKVSTSKG